MDSAETNLYDKTNTLFIPNPTYMTTSNSTLAQYTSGQSPLFGAEFVHVVVPEDQVHLVTAEGVALPPFQSNHQEPHMVEMLCRVEEVNSFPASRYANL